MGKALERREFLQIALGGTIFCLGGSGVFSLGPQAPPSRLVSPGCRRSKVRVARLYLGVPKSHYPNPTLDLEAERRFYDTEFAKLKAELNDVDFVGDELVGTAEQVQALRGKLQDVDGVLAIHLSLWTLPALKELLALGLPTTIFSAPYSGHEWYDLAAIRRQKLGARMECLLTSDYRQLARAIRPFRAMHHLREAKILNLATAQAQDYAEQVKKKFGTEIKLISPARVLELYNSVRDEEARAEADRWVSNAVAVVEPSTEEIFNSCKLALAFEKLLDEEEATVLTVDCYGSMFHQLPAYPCMGFARLNDLGWGGICQSDLPCAVVHILLQGLTGRPGFVCNPTFDFDNNAVILIHCLGSTRMDGPDKPAAPYKLRSVMERQEGAVPQVLMRVGQEVTQAILHEMTSLRYFTGQITDTPETMRGCRSKITVKLDGDAQKLWQNWTAGIHRVSCYGKLKQELAHFCRFKGIELIDEAGWSPPVTENPEARL